MSYHLTVLRTSDGKQIPISKAEFAVAARQLPALALDASETSARLLRGPELRATLRWNEGEIWTKTPESDVRAVMIELAGRLGARVRGDELETYRTVDDSYLHPDDAAENDRSVSERATRRHRRWVWNAVRMVVVAVVLGLLIAKAMRD